MPRKPGVGVEPPAEGGDDEVVAVVLAGQFGAEVALEGHEAAAGDIGGHPGGVLREVVAERVGVLAAGGVNGGVAGVLLGEEAGVGEVLRVGRALEADVAVPGGAGWHGVGEGAGEGRALGVDGVPAASAGQVVRGVELGVRFRPWCVVGDAEGVGFPKGVVGGAVLEVEAGGEDSGVAEGGEGGCTDAVDERGGGEGGDVADLEEAGADAGEVGRGPGGDGRGVGPRGGGEAEVAGVGR